MDEDLHPSLTPEAQAEKERMRDWMPPWERQRISKHTPATKTGRQRRERNQRRAQERNRKAHNRRMQKRGRK